jgi:hypothetical protein
MVKLSSSFTNGACDWGVGKSVSTYAVDFQFGDYFSEANVLTARYRAQKAAKTARRAVGILPDQKCFPSEKVLAILLGREVSPSSCSPVYKPMAVRFHGKRVRVRWSTGKERPGLSSGGQSRSRPNPSVPHFWLSII